MSKVKAVVFTLGCKVNEVESDNILSGLQSLGWEVSSELGYADLYILNTCAVTKEAEKKSRQLVARVRKFNAQAPVIVCGCASQKDETAFESKGVSYVLGTGNKVQKTLAFVSQNFPVLREYEEQIPSKSHTRAFIKIEDGCNNFCSYCVIPYLRGRVAPVPSADIIKEVQNCTAPELVLTGINISAWSEGEETLADLISKLSFCTARIRLGSLECRVIDERLLQALKNLPDFAPQFHLSLQSGSNATLKRMNRKYTREEYLQKCALIYQYFPDAAITTDIIAGFCDESDADFEESLSIIQEAGLARVHAFAFSPREGTVAFKMKDIPADVKSARLHRLLQAGEEARITYVQKFIGQTLPCILEEQTEGFTVGTSSNYIKVYVQGEIATGGKATVKLIANFKDGALAELV